MLATLRQHDFALQWFDGLISMMANKGPGLLIPALEPSLLPGCPTACDGPVDRKEYDRTDGSYYDGPDKAATADTDEAGQKATYQGSRYPEYYRDDEAARIVARHNELGERACDPADDDPADNCAYTHGLLPPSRLVFYA
jgi:hypothetical protein